MTTAENKDVVTADKENYKTVIFSANISDDCIKSFFGTYDEIVSDHL